MQTFRFVCSGCKRIYRLKAQNPSCEWICYHCGSVLQPAPAVENKAGGNQVGFNALLEQVSQKQHIVPEEMRLIEEMRAEGLVDTAWLRRNYEPGSVRETQEMDLEVIEEFKPLIFECYQALYAVGEGGSGIVYKGWKIGSDEIVAIKRLNPDKGRDPVSRERFFRELHFLKDLSHPNILQLLDGGEKDGEYFLVTPFVDGGSLKERIKALPPIPQISDLAPLFAIMIQIGKALEYAHEHGLVHRDVKPANILLDGDHPYLADFGLAKQIEDTSRKNLDTSTPKVTHGAVGTPCYMAPELWQQKATPLVDIYALAVILYEMLTGTYPFPGSTPAQILARQLNSKPIPPVSPESLFPLEFNRLILKGLDRDPEKRHKSAKEFTRELTQILK